MIKGYSGGAKLKIPTKTELDGCIMHQYFAFKSSPPASAAV
jgi:hypothetical protein